MKLTIWQIRDPDLSGITFGQAFCQGLGQQEVEGAVSPPRSKRSTSGSQQHHWYMKYKIYLKGQNQAILQGLIPNERGFQTDPNKRLIYTQNIQIPNTQNRPFLGQLDRGSVETPGHLVS